MRNRPRSVRSPHNKPSPSAVPHRSPSMGAGNLEWVPGLTTSDARHDMSVVVPPYITDTDAVVVCCTRARPSVRTVASFKYHRTVHVWLGGQVRGLSTRSGGVVCSMLRLDPYDMYPGSHRQAWRGRARPLRRVTRSSNLRQNPRFCPRTRVNSSKYAKKTLGVGGGDAERGAGDGTLDTIVSGSTALGSR